MRGPQTACQSFFPVSGLIRPEPDVRMIDGKNQYFRQYFRPLCGLLDKGPKDLRKT